jgi:hypothetical protein
VQRYIGTGADLARLGGADLDAKLGIRNPLHRKKLVLAMQAVFSFRMIFTVPDPIFWEILDPDPSVVEPYPVLIYCSGSCSYCGKVLVLVPVPDPV